MQAEQNIQDAQNMDSDFIVVDGVSNHVGNNESQNQISKVRIKAKRDIITDAGFIRKGQTGYVTRTWLQRIASGGCSCGGSLNWFSYA